MCPMRNSLLNSSTLLFFYSSQSTGIGLRRCFILLTTVCVFLVILSASLFRVNQNEPDKYKNPLNAAVARITRPSQSSQHMAQKTNMPSSKKPFIYLTQTGKCLPPNLASSAKIGDPETCKCDVIVLSYKTECEDRNHPPHISYIFDPTTTWASGRNLLFFNASKRATAYHYYIFIDDDVVLGFNSFTPAKMRTLQPFRVFEEWLLDYEPAFGFANYQHHGAIWTFKKREKLCGIVEKSLVIPIVWFDGCLNAYHYQAVGHILPYPTLDKSESWYIPNKHIMSAVELAFRGQAMMLVPVGISNIKHRVYPRRASVGEMAKYWLEFIEKIQEKAPLVYRNHSLWNKFKEGLGKHMDSSSTYCMNATRHLPIIPFAHFDRKTSKV